MFSGFLPFAQNVASYLFVVDLQWYDNRNGAGLVGERVERGVNMYVSYIV